MPIKKKLQWWKSIHHVWQNKQFFRYCIILLLCFVSPVTIISCSKQTIKPKNIILISIDTLRADHLGCYGYKENTSPNIDRYAKSGVVFRNAFSPSSWTGPAHLSMMTSLSPIAHGLIYYGSDNKLNSKTPTLASILRNNHFETAAFTGGGWVSNITGVDIGFSTFKTPDKHFKKNIIAAQKWLDHIGEKKFFLFLHGYDVHKPYRPPPPFNTKFSKNYSGKYDVDKFQPDEPKPNETDLRYVISQYDGEIASVDQLLNSFFNYLKGRGLLKNTLVFITADHGDEFYEHGSVDHIHTLYDELIHVPLIVFGPTITPAIITSQVGTIDILPTILDLLGIKHESERFQGCSLINYLLTSKTGNPPEDVFSFTGFEKYPYHLSSIRTARWKLIHNDLSGMKNINLNSIAHRPRYTYKFKHRAEDYYELYDLKSDPQEKHNLFDPKNEIAISLQKRLIQYIKVSKSIALKAKKRSLMTSEQIKNLKSLGYLK